MNTDKIYAEQLANEYAPKDTSKVVALRKLDAKAKLPATVFTYTFGIVAALVTGVGMCLSMKVIVSSTNTMFFLGVVEELQDCPRDKLYFVTPKYLTPYLNYIKDHKRLFQTAVENASTLRLGDTYDKMFSCVFSPILERHQVPAQDRPYIMSFYIHGLMAILTEWLKKDCSDSIDHVIAVMQQCIITPQQEQER